MPPRPSNPDAADRALRVGDGRRVGSEPGESLDGLLRRFRRSVEKAGVIGELRRRQHARSPSQRRREKRARAAARRARAARRLARGGVA